MKGRSPHAKMRPFLVIFAILFVICHTFVATPKRLCTKVLSTMVTNKQIQLKIYMYNEGWRPVLTDGSPSYYFFTHCRHSVLTNHDGLIKQTGLPLLSPSWKCWDGTPNLFETKITNIIAPRPHRGGNEKPHGCTLTGRPCSSLSHEVIPRRRPRCYPGAT